MKNNLERFVRDNREDFDDKEPSAKLWQKIEAGLDKTSLDRTGLDNPGLNRQEPNKTSPFQQIHRNHSQSSGRQIGWPFLDWRVAASIAVLLLLGGFLYMNQQYGVTKQPEVVAANPTYAKEVVQYTRLIDTKRTELKQMTEDNPELYQEFATDLDRLENSYKSLKADLPKNPNQEVLIQAMIQNLQLQINLLNEQLRVIERIKQQTHESTPV
ncbi:hypothetical protein [Spirosoma validum]|uniref:Anti-sigma factor n=1 Tax=Spirosoma validum TaxID=2771355 RepID=A0A927B3S9_9BACT|nr:hypothetical protein [Spirosoma validum]MBD2754788.1 hypothetical protein [Spirosoma validum]